MSKPYRYRDLSLIEVDPGTTLAIACDSSGGIGPKERDVVKVPGYVVGRFIARVPLMELLSINAVPFSVVDTLTVEPGVGDEIRRGVSDEMALVGLDPRVSLNGSMERNVPTLQTGVGITALGLIRGDTALMRQLGKGDALGCFGLPKVGPEVTLDDPEIADLTTVLHLLTGGLSEIVPVGSRGLHREVEDLARMYRYRFRWRPEIDLDLDKPAGPATCLIAAGSERALLSAASGARTPFRLLGEFYA